MKKLNPTPKTDLKRIKLLILK